MYHLRVCSPYRRRLQFPVMAKLTRVIALTEAAESETGIIIDAMLSAPAEVDEPKPIVGWSLSLMV